MSEQSSSLPIELINGLTEWSPSAFVLFTINPQGCPEIFHCFDSNASSLAMQAFIALWVRSVQDAQAQSMRRLIEGPNGEEVSE